MQKLAQGGQQDGEGGKKNRARDRGREQDRATDKNNDKEKEKSRDGEQHRGVEKEKEASGALQRVGGNGQGAAERNRERRDEQEGQRQWDTE